MSPRHALCAAATRGGEAKRPAQETRTPPARQRPAGESYLATTHAGGLIYLLGGIAERSTLEGHTPAQVVDPVAGSVDMRLRLPP
jgi:hypothetical protein